MCKDFWYQGKKNNIYLFELKPQYFENIVNVLISSLIYLFSLNKMVLSFAYAEYKLVRLKIPIPFTLLKAMITISTISRHK